jgi:hypothetical protein
MTTQNINNLIMDTIFGEVDVSLTIQNNDYKMISEIKQDTSA